MIVELYERLEKRSWQDYVSLPYVFLIPVLMVLSLVFFTLGATVVRADAFRFIETTGRAVVIDPETQQEARMLALEEALYLAALEGGATINGFSAISTDTAIEDHFVIRPASQILDYTITNEIIEDQHYSVSIRAAVGELPKTACPHRRNVNMTVFAPAYSEAPNTPPEAAPMARQVMAAMIDMIDDNLGATVRLATDTELDPAGLGRKNDNYDYQALTTGLVRVQRGDFALVPEIVLTGALTGGAFTRKKDLHAKIMLHLFSGEDYEFIETFTASSVIEVENNTLFRTVNVLTKKRRPKMLDEMLVPAGPLINNMIASLECRPLTATLTLVDGQLTVPIGSYHGMAKNALAVANGTDTPWQIMRVTAVNAKSATLTPLNRNRDMSRLAGQTVKFMEVPQ